MVVIDLLSKMRFGDSGDYGQVGKRFKDFVNEFHNEENISIDIGVILYAFRNALHHSFNMATNVRLGDVDAYNFCLISAPSDQRLLSVNSNVVKINFNALEVFVNNLIESYKTHILHCENDAECDKFSVMLQKYGIMRIG
ncbi:hypothetical protein [Komagataeibacter xylinus]|uniref:hypothetical protein n=1 Tax=Komagataeibacter xylinus TaxID=28448 RepID=UPI00280AB10E|nr:hypothetical protein [Komagataeibacter xylinus]